MSEAEGAPLPAGLRGWIEGAAGGRVVKSVSHHEGASRSAWNVDVACDGGPRPLFVLQDKREGGGSARDAVVLRALASSGVPVPEVVAADEARSAILLSRLPGRSDFPAAEVPEAQQEKAAAHLMTLTAKLHALDPRSLDIPHLALPETPEECAQGTIAQARGAANALGDAADPFFTFALDWLDANVPSKVDRFSLVHSDMGPGNFLYEAGRVTGIVDWEVAHYGDPMEDLAAIAIRDMATPIGSLPRRFEEYAKASGRPVDLARVHYYRALVLVRNSLMIGLGLAHPTEATDVEEMTMYQTLLVRAAALVLCDNLGIDRPAPAGPIDDRVETEREDAAALLGVEPSTLPDAGAIDAALREALSRGDGSGEARRADFARYFARRMHRLGEERKALLGPLFERLPQPLVAQ